MTPTLGFVVLPCTRCLATGARRARVAPTRQEFCLGRLLLLQTIRIRIASPSTRTGRTMGSYECHGQSGSVDRDGDRPSPAVRKKASWLVPGGAIYQRTAPKPRRPVERKTVAT